MAALKHASQVSERELFQELVHTRAQVDKLLDQQHMLITLLLGTLANTDGAWKSRCLPSRHPFIHYLLLHLQLPSRHSRVLPHHSRLPTGRPCPLRPLPAPPLSPQPARAQWGGVWSLGRPEPSRNLHCLRSLLAWGRSAHQRPAAGRCVQAADGALLQKGTTLGEMHLGSCTHPARVLPACRWPL